MLHKCNRCASTWLRRVDRFNHPWGEVVIKQNHTRFFSNPYDSRIFGPEDGMRNAECGMRNAECGMRNAECGMRNAEVLIFYFEFPTWIEKEMNNLWRRQNQLHFTP